MPFRKSTLTEEEIKSMNTKLIENRIPLADAQKSDEELLFKITGHIPNEDYLRTMLDIQ